MNEEKLILKDIVNINDSNSAKGFVIIKDENGKILVSKSNMIVKYGKLYLYKLFTDTFRIGTTSLALPASDFDWFSNDDVSLSQMRFSNNSNETSYFSEYTAMTSDNCMIYDISLSEMTAVVIEGHPCLKITKNVSFNTNPTNNLSHISTLELILKSESKQNNQLFSRIIFDKIPVNASSSFILDYYIYF